MTGGAPARRLLVIGRGLLGGAVRRAAPAAAGVTQPIPWTAGEAAVRAAVTAEVGRFVAAQGAWGIAWCAGAGVVGTSAVELAAEAAGVDALWSAIESAAPGRGAVFLASSAGGVWGIGSRSMLDETTPPSPRSDYGHAKLRYERRSLDAAANAGVALLVGRMSNLYGPAQNLAKPQGFVSHLMRSMLVHQPFALTVPGETQRDFLHVDDAAGRIAAWLGDAAPQAAPLVKVIAAGRTHSLSRVIELVHAASGVRPKVVMSRNAASALQPRFVRLRSTVLTELDRRVPARSAEVGLKQTWQAMLRQHAAGQLTPA